MASSCLTVNIENIDEVIEKVSRLNELLKEAISLIDSLRSTTTLGGEFQGGMTYGNINN